MCPRVLRWFLLVSLVTLSIEAQENKKLDSLLTLYKNQKDDLSKVKSLHDIIKIEIYNRTNAKNHIDELLKLSKKLDYKKGIAQANYFRGEYFYHVDQIDSAYLYYKSAFDQHTSINDVTGKITARYALARLKFAEAQYDATIELIDENLEIQGSEKPIDSSGLASSYYLKGFAHLEKGNFKIALTETLKSLKILKKLNEPLRIAGCIGILGEIEYELGNLEKSLEYDKQALSIFKEQNNKFQQAQILFTMADTYTEIKEFDLAINHLNESLALSREIKSLSTEAMVLGNLGDVAIGKREYAKALDYLEESLKISKKIDMPSITVENWLYLSTIYGKTDQPAKAVLYLDSVIENAKKTGAKDFLKLALSNRSEQFKKMMDYKRAYIDYVDFHIISDSMFNTAKSRQIEELRTIHDTEKKEQQIALQEKEITVLEQQKKISTQQKLLLGGGLLLSLLSFYGLRQKMKRNKIEKEKVEAELEFKKKELTTHALNLARKNETLENLKARASEWKEKESTGRGYNQLIRAINFNLQDDNNWDNFSRYFEEVHKDFHSNVKAKYPNITSNELRLLALLKMNLSSKEIANILNISAEGIKKARYRLRKKLDLSTEDSLQDLVLSL